MPGNSLPLIGTHAHIFTPGLRIAANARYTPDYEATLDQYLEVLSSNGMDRGVLVQPSFLGSDNSYLLAVLATMPVKLRGVIVVSDRGVQSELSDERIQALHEAGVLGVRLNLVGKPLPDLSSAAWKTAAESMARRQWHFEIQASGLQWSELASILRHWPTKVVVDHFGLPNLQDSRIIETLLNLAALDHVWVKVSAPYRSSYDSATTMFSQLLERGSGDRLVFGSDWPFTQHENNSYSRILTWVRNLAGEDQLTRMLTSNAYSLLRWPAVSDTSPAKLARVGT